MKHTLWFLAFLIPGVFLLLTGHARGVDVLVIDGAGLLIAAGLVIIEASFDEVLANQKKIMKALNIADKV